MIVMSNSKKLQENEVYSNMSTLMTPTLYVARIPDELHSVIQDIDDLLSLESLAKKLSLRDIFYLVYEQTTDAGFNDFLTRYALSSFTTTPANIAWMSEVKSQYDAYIRLREDESKINGVTPTSSFPIHVTHSLLSPRLLGKYKNILVLTPVNGDSVLRLDKKTFKFSLISMLYDFMGYEALRNHTVSNYIMGLGD